MVLADLCQSAAGDPPSGHDDGHGSGGGCLRLPNEESDILRELAESFRAERRGKRLRGQIEIFRVKEEGNGGI